MSDDFLGSVAQEDVSFITQITRAVKPGDNFHKLLVFIEGTVTTGAISAGRFIQLPSAFVPLRVGSDIFVAEVTKDDYADVTNGLLKSWLQDFFYSQHAQTAYLVVYGPDLGDTPTAPEIEAAADLLEAAYEEVKAYAYHKTVCAGADAALLPALAVRLAQLCVEDGSLLSAAPYYPMSADEASLFAADPIYAALKTASPDFKTADAFMTAYHDGARNGALFSLGLTFSLINSTGTPIGNNIDFWATDGISCSGPDGSNLSKADRLLLKNANISFFKPVGDGTQQVVAVGPKTLSGKMMQAYWIVNYINYMCKVLTASYITKPNMMRDASTYAGIINIMTAQIGKFGTDGSNRLRNVVISAPSFINLPPADNDEIIIPKAWSAEYNDQVHKVQVYGNLIIAE